MSTLYIFIVMTYTILECGGIDMHNDRDTGLQFSPTDYTEDEDTYKRWRRSLIELSNDLMFGWTPYDIGSDSNCNDQLLWLKFTGCFIREHITTPQSRWKEKYKDDTVKEMAMMRTWCKNKVFFKCWNMIEDCCPRPSSHYSFIVNYLSHTCFIYEEAEKDHFGPCSFNNIQTTYLRVLKQNNATNSTCKSVSSMGPLLIHNAMLMSMHKDLDSCEDNLCDESFKECMKHLVINWDNTMGRYREQGCSRSIIEKITEIDGLHNRVSVLVQFLQRNGKSFDDVLKPAIKKYKSYLQPGLFTRSRYSSDQHSDL